MEDEVIMAPVTGEIIDLKQVNDGIFSSEFMGKGAAIIPKEGIVLSPCNGLVTATSPTGHAYGLKSDGGAELLIHLGIDTVELNGASFESFVKKRQRVVKGEKIAELRLQMIKDCHLDPAVIIVVTNSADYASVKRNKQKRIASGGKLLFLKAQSENSRAV
ncbi:MAG: PTS glucose transporter subunit IIA [Sporolactobacillus sp.]